MGNIIPFNYGSNKIQVVKDDNDNPWWIAKEVCNVLDIKDVSDTMKRLDEDEKLIRVLPVSGQNREIWLVNEAGLYTLIIRSNKPDAKKFKRWITHEVLPSIRKTGKYEVGNMSELDLIIRSAEALKSVQQRQNEHEKRLEYLEAKTHQNSGHTGYWTITAWCRLNNLNLNIHEAMQKGREAARISKEWRVSIGKVPDERFGEVNSYREDVLEELFSNAEVAA